MGNDLVKTRILISGLGGSLFPYLHEKLKENYELFYVDSDVTLKNLYPNYNFFPAPSVTDESYKNFVKDLISKYSITTYLPLIDEEISVAHEIADELKTSLTLVSPNTEFCKLAIRKDLLMKKLDESGISSIASCNGKDFKWNDQTIFVKPISGRGSRGIKKISSEEELKAYYVLEKYNKEDILVQEYIEGEEYTVGVLTNKLNDILYISSRKILKKKGITIRAVTENNPIIDEAIIKINKYLTPQGPFNIQLYITKNNEVKIFEINPRFSTTSIMSYEDGVDEIGLFLKFQKTKYQDQAIRPGENLILHRRWENVFYENQ